MEHCKNRIFPWNYRIYTIYVETEKIGTSCPIGYTGDGKEVIELERLQISLAAARVNAGFTQENVANEMHVSKNTIVNWEKGKVIPSFATMQALSSIYKIPVDNIFLQK